MFADVICWELSFDDNTCGNIADEFFRAISEVLNAASMLATISLYGIFDGAGANFRPFAEL